MLIESNAKPIDDRLGNSPEKIEKRAGGKKSIYAHSYNKIKILWNLSIITIYYID